MCYKKARPGLRPGFCSCKGTETVELLLESSWKGLSKMFLLISSAAPNIRTSPKNSQKWQFWAGFLRFFPEPVRPGFLWPDHVTRHVMPIP